MGGMGQRVGILVTETAKIDTEKCWESNRAYEENYEQCCLKTH